MATDKATGTRRNSRGGRPNGATTPPRAARSRSNEIRAWEEDPGGPGAGLKPVAAGVPALGAGKLPVTIAGRAPSPDLYQPGTSDFRFWVAAEALRRGADLWSSIAPKLTWHPTVGRRLETDLDHGEDLNAYYDRQGLRFFHGRAANKTVYSGESPDVVCHELGHAVLDALRPQLFDANFIEVASFHESFGDMSAMLCALQLKSVRDQVLVETGGSLYRTSRLSRLAEQLGWAIRLVAPDAVEPDCLRNAVNSFFYKSPESLPPSGPASTLCSEPHSFSRVFTAAFLEALGGMFRLQATHDEKSLQKSSLDAAALLVDAVTASPVVPSYYSQIAAHVIEADANRFGGANAPALKQAFLSHGILSVDSAEVVSMARPAPGPVPAGRARPGASAAATTAAARATRGAGGPLHFVALAGGRYGLDADLMVPAVAETKRFGVAGAAPDIGAAASPAHDRAAESFVEDLFRRGCVDVGTAGGDGVRAMAAAPSRPSKLSHEVRRENGSLVLMRRFFDCGLAAAGR